MATTAATTEKKPRKFNRHVSTRQQKVDAINYVRSMAEKKWKVTDGNVMKRFGVHYLVRKLINNGVLTPTGKVNGSGYSESGLYTFHAGGVTPADIVDMLWQLHGKVENGEDKKPVQKAFKFPQPRVEKTSEPVEIGDMMSIPKNAPAVAQHIASYSKVYNSAGASLVENIDEWLRMCDQFKIQSRGEFIFAQLKTLGYVK